VKKYFNIMMLTLLISALIASSAHGFPFFGGGAPKREKGGSVFGIVIGPANISQPGAHYAPIEGAVVEIRGPKGTMNTTTDNMGGYKFQKVPPGEWVLSVNKPGYGPHVEKFTLKDMELKRIDNIALIPGGGLSTPKEVIVPDTAYVAFAKIETGKYAKRTVMWKKGAILHGADPFALDGNAPPDYSRGMNPYDRGHQVSAYENSLMTIDPKDSNEIGYIKLNGRPTWLHFNIAGTKLYVATDQNYVLIYDILHNNVLVGSIPLNGSATDMALTSDGRYLFISYSSGILVVDTDKHIPVNNIEVPQMSNGELGIPMAIAIGRGNSQLYVVLSAPNSGEVVAIDAYTKQPVARAMVGSQPTGMAISPDGSKLYVANHNSATVSILTTSPLALVNNVSVGVSPTKVAVTPDDSKVYVTCKGSNTVSVLSGMTGSAIGRITVGKEPMGIGITGDGSRVYVANHREGTVSIIDTNADYVIKTTRPQPHARPYGVAIKP